MISVDEKELAHMREGCRLLRAAESVDFRADRTLEYAALNKWLTADNPDAAENEWNEANNGGMP